MSPSCKSDDFLKYWMALGSLSGSIWDLLEFMYRLWGGASDQADAIVHKLPCALPTWERSE
jgi:hypothetical protein